MEEFKIISLIMAICCILALIVAVVATTTEAGQELFFGKEETIPVTRQTPSGTPAVIDQTRTGATVQETGTPGPGNGGVSPDTVTPNQTKPEKIPPVFNATAPLNGTMNATPNGTPPGMGFPPQNGTATGITPGSPPSGGVQGGNGGMPGGTAGGKPPSGTPPSGTPPPRD